MVMLRFSLRMHRNKTILHGQAVIFVFTDRLTKDLDDLIGSFIIHSIWRPQGCPFHVRSDMVFVWSHCIHGPCRMFMGHLHLFHTSPLRQELTDLSRARAARCRNQEPSSDKNHSSSKLEAGLWMSRSI